MKTFYFTFGQDHAHRVNGVTWDKDLVCMIDAEDENSARKIMHENFGNKWAFSYTEETWERDNLIRHFPRGAQPL